MRIYVDRQLCIGAGNCVAHAPRVFQLDDEEIAVVLDAEGKTEPEHALWVAAKDCPTGAVVLEDDRGNILYP